MRAQHRRYAVVAMTNEYRTSQVYVHCHGQALLARKKRKGKNGKWKTVRLHGAIECVKSMPSGQVGDILTSQGIPML